MNGVEIYSFILAVLTAIASGMVGSFALMRRMTLAGDSFSHIALPGIGIALLYSWSPVIGGAVALLLGALIIWKIEKVSNLNADAVIGVLFALSLAIGALAIGEDHELIETLFGGIGGVTVYDFITGVVIALIVISFVFTYRRALVLTLVSKDLARTAGIKTERLELYFLLIFALTVILGMKFLGVLLMGSLIIIPAAAARNIAHNLNGMLIAASSVALISVVLGIGTTAVFAIALGPAVIIVASAVFLGSLVFKLTQGNARTA